MICQVLGQIFPANVTHASGASRVNSPLLLTLGIHSPNPNLDLAALIDQPVTVSLASGHAHVANLGARTFRGIVVEAELVHALQPAAAQEGLSTYHLRIAPEIHRMTLRRNQRTFQHLSTPEIIDELLAEYGIEKVWRIDRAAYPKHEFKVQYAETDYNFFARLLEEAGIAFTFPESEEGKLTLFDDLTSNPVRPGPPLRYVDNPNGAAEKEFITKVRFGRQVRPGAVSFRDHEFRNPEFVLMSDAAGADGIERRLEQFHFDQAAFLVETDQSGGTPVADDKGIARHDLGHGNRLARQALEAFRTEAQSIHFETNAFDLEPGVVFTLDAHPHPALNGRKFLVIETMLEAIVDDEWTLSGQAVFADAPYRPPCRTKKPIVHGFQSATVVGPAGQEIHTDEYGRVRVQFHWDRDGQRNDNSSCWVRVNAGWSGMGYGMVVLPRIGQEVLIAFAEGDPDLPFVVGRSYNAVQQVPYKLSEYKTRSTWKSNSSVGSGGFNEIMFEDQAAKELVWQQAEKDRTRLVREDEFATIGHDREKLVKNDEVEQTRGYHTRWVGKNATSVVKAQKRECVEGDAHLVVVGDRSEQIDGKQSLLVVADRHERVEGSHSLHAGGAVHLFAGEGQVTEAKDVTLSGPAGFLRIDEEGVTISGTLVKVNVTGKPGKGSGSKPEDAELAQWNGPTDPPVLTVAEVSFKVIKEINNDTKGDFAPPHWMRTWPKEKPADFPDQYPVAFVRDTHITLDAMFDILDKAKAPKEGDIVIITGKAKLGRKLTMQWKATAQQNVQGRYEIRNVASDVPLPNYITCFLPLRIDWSWSPVTSPESKFEAGKSENDVYVLLGGPQSTNVDGPLMCWTTVDISCRYGKASSDELKAVENIYTAFTQLRSRNPKPLKMMRDTNITLKYWSPIYDGPYEPPITSTRQILQNDDGNGHCGSWAAFMINMLKVHGIVSATKFVVWYAKDHYNVGMLVKNWTFNEPGDVNPPEKHAIELLPEGAVQKVTQNIDFTHRVMSKLLGTYWPELAKPGACIDISGAASQGNSDPMPLFWEHALVKYGGRYYDPSYGTSEKAKKGKPSKPGWATPLDWEMGSLDGIFWGANRSLWGVNPGPLYAAKHPGKQVFDFEVAKDEHGNEQKT